MKMFPTYVQYRTHFEHKDEFNLANNFTSTNCKKRLKYDQLVLS